MSYFTSNEAKISISIYTGEVAVLMQNNSQRKLIVQSCSPLKLWVATFYVPKPAQPSTGNDPFDQFTVQFDYLIPAHPCESH